MVPRATQRFISRPWTLVLPVALALAAFPAHAEDAASVHAAGPVSIAALHSDLKFNLLAPPRAQGGEFTGALREQALRIAGGLEVASKTLFPAAMAKIGTFDVFVTESREIAVQSSATGRIALNAGFADLKPTDDWLALVLAREMGHVVAGHHDSNSTASMVTSVLMNLVIPGSGLIKSALSLAGSQIAENADRERQLGEADAIALKLLVAAGYSERALALNLALGPHEAQLGASSWARAFAETARTVVARSRSAVEATVVAPDTAARPAVVASTDAHLHAAAPRLAPEDIVLRRRPSGMPGPLLLDGNAVPVRRIE